MATILPFVVRPAASGAARASDGDAAIVIFPGVRYEPVASSREDNRPTDDGSPRSRKPQ